MPCFLQQERENKLKSLAELLTTKAPKTTLKLFVNLNLVILNFNSLKTSSNYRKRRKNHNRLSSHA